MTNRFGGFVPSRPTVLEISDTGVVFHDAGDIWGKSGKNTRMN